MFPSGGEERQGKKSSHRKGQRVLEWGSPRPHATPDGPSVRSPEGMATPRPGRGSPRRGRHGWIWRTPRQVLQEPREASRAPKRWQGRPGNTCVCRDTRGSLQGLQAESPSQFLPPEVPIPSAPPPLRLSAPGGPIFQPLPQEVLPPTPKKSQPPAPSPQEVPPPTPPSKKSRPPAPPQGGHAPPQGLSSLSPLRSLCVPMPPEQF